MTLMMLVVKPSMESLKDGILMWTLKILPKNKLKKYIIQTIGEGKCDEVPPQLRHIYFDMCVNFGRSGAVKVLQQAVNSKNRNKIKVDGGIGPNTLKAIQNISVDRVRAYRVLRFANIVIDKPNQEKFWLGWFRRATEV